MRYGVSERYQVPCLGSGGDYVQCLIAAMTECSEVWEAVYGLTVDQADLASHLLPGHPSQSLSAAVGSFVECRAWRE